MEFSPVAFYSCDRKFRFETPRQSVYALSGGVIRFEKERNFEAALPDLQGFSRIWVIFCFHLNGNSVWKPKVRPPVSPDRSRIGVFATRSPHRPNPIGMSCVELLEVRKLELVVGACDLLDGTPVLDVKPYIPAADSFPDARTGWLERARPEVLSVSFSESAMERICFLRESGGPDLENFCRIQLALDPCSPERKRLFSSPQPGFLRIGCRTWRAEYSVRAGGVFVTDIFSGYSPEERASAEDPYGDKALHHAFVRRFGGENF